MDSSGGGVTFSELDLVNAKRTIGLMNKARFDDMNSVQIMEAGQALEFIRRLIPIIEMNILEMKVVAERVE